MSGLPGAGKDSYIKKYLPGLPVISLDDIRVSMHIDPTDKTGNGHVIQTAKNRRGCIYGIKRRSSGMAPTAPGSCAPNWWNYSPPIRPR
jgi:hypothetical protein